MIENEGNENNVPVISYTRGQGKYKLRNFFKSRIFIILLCSLLVISSFFLGMHVDYITRIKSTYDYALLNSVLDYVNKYYYKDVDADTLIYYACKGVVDNLDPYSTIYTESTQSSDDAGYIGLEMSYGVNGEFRVMWVNEGSPAEVAGISVGDYIVSVNGVKVEGDFVDSFVALMGNKKVGDKITLDVKSSKDGLVRSLDLTAAAYNEIRVRLVNDFTGLPGGIEVPSSVGYIGFTTFNEVALNQFDLAVKEFKEAGKTNLILDLRENTGGDGEVLRKIAKYLLKPEEGEAFVMRLIKADGSQRDYFTTGEGEYIFKDNEEGKIVILTDGYTASAAEALIGAMLLDGNCELVGSTTYGKGVGQSTVPFPSASNPMFNLKLTIGKYYFKGDVSAYVKGETGFVDNIDGKGFTPKSENVVYSGRVNALLDDPVMQRAISLISESE